MHRFHGVRSPRQIMILFVGTTFVLLAGLGWFGSRLFQRDRAVEVQRIRDQLESATDLISAEMRQNLADVEEQLTRLSLVPVSTVEDTVLEYSKDLGEDALIVVFTPESVRAYPSQRLLYYPALSTPEAPGARAFTTGEVLEFRAADFGRAIAYFQQLARAYDQDDNPIRAGALLRLARNQRKAGRFDAALETYQELAAMGSVSVGEWPAELVARRARCDLLEQQGRDAELSVEARKLNADLDRSRWRLTRSAYMHFTAEVRKWLPDNGVSLGESSGATPVALSLTVGVDALWERWQRERRTLSVLRGRSSLMSHERSVFLLWRGTLDQLVALVAGPSFLEQRVVAPLQGLLERLEVGVVLADGEGTTLVSHHTTTGSKAQNVVRTMSETRLPWTLRVMSTDPEAALEQVATRGRLLFAGLGLLALMAVTGSYFSARAMSREIEIARLQSDFVSAVSHEFRTPLTSLRQFTDLLADGRVSTDAERSRCYAALRRGTQRLTRLVENVLDFGRMEAHLHGFIVEPLRVKDWVERVISEFQQEVQESGYHVEFAWSGPHDVSIQADETALERALWNLLDNAVKYSPGFKTIWVEGAVEESTLILRVRDRGVGVPANEQREIFRKFVRGSVPTGNAVNGTGLGLALVDQIVEAHGGKVRVESRVGEGSTFSLILPAQR